ncbi:unnamed protein product [Diamesa serratosioi]
MLLLFLTIILALNVLIYKSYGRQLFLSAKLKGPKGYPIVGNGLDLINKSPVEFVEIINKYIKDYGGCFRLWLANKLIIFVTDPKDIEAILTNTKLITKSDEYDFMKPWLGTGLLTSTGKKWSSRRKIITPTFHFKILEQFVEIFDEQSDIFVLKLAQFKDQGSFNIFPVTALCALDIICKSAMGTSSNSQENSSSEYVKNVNEIADIIHKRSYDFILRYDIFFKFTPTYQRQKKLLKSLHDYTDKVIMDRREMLMIESKKEINLMEPQRDEVFGAKRKIALLDLLLQSSVDGVPLTNNDIREEIDTFMFEGHDTTTSGISFAFYNIAKYPEVQQKVFEEIVMIFGNDVKKQASISDLNDLKYLDLVIKETLRLYPSVGMFGRKALEEVEINGKIIPKDSNIILGAYFMGRDPNIWENPEQFIPERFDVEMSAEKTNPFGYIPFSAGSRNCIGQKFAMLEMKSTISKVLRHYQLKVQDNYAPIDVLELIIKSKNGIMLEIKDRY